MTIVYPPASASLIASVLMTHEGGHYYSALLHEGDPDIPIMIPVVIGAVGMTRVRNLPNLSKRAKRYVIASGPIAGVTTAIACAPVVIMFGGKAMLITLCGITILELYNGILGSDGKKWRMEKEHHGMA